MMKAKKDGHFADVVRCIVVCVKADMNVVFQLKRERPGVVHPTQASPLA